jgi:hypothetical protein
MIMCTRSKQPRKVRQEEIDELVKQVKDTNAEIDKMKLGDSFDHEEFVRQSEKTINEMMNENGNQNESL